MAGKVIQLRKASEFTTSREAPVPRWGRDELAGRLTEISADGASAVLTAAVGLVLEAQREDEPVAWITPADTSFFPPDLVDSGVDLDALAVVRVPPGRDAARAAARAADQLARSGAFGLILLDLGKHAELATPAQGRLVGLAQRHDAAIVLLTEKSATAASVGSMVAIRAEAVREALGDGTVSDRFRCKVRVIKDKRRGPGWHHAEVVRGPAGLY
jgi:recombination protein RecA